MSENKYGELLDKVMNKPNDSSAVDAANRFRDALNKQRMDEINNRNRAIRQREEKEIAEQERLAKQNEYINSLLQNTKNRIDAENSRKQEEEKERERMAQSKKVMENLNWTPKKINR